MALADISQYAVAHWSMDEESGNRIDSINGHTLTDNNTVGFGVGKFGNAGDFELSNGEYLSASHNLDFSPGNNDFTIRAWVKLESKPLFANLTIINKGKGVSHEYSLEHNYNLNKIRALFYNNSGTPLAVANSTTTSTNTWYLIHAWHDSLNNEIGLSVNAGTPVTTAFDSGGVRVASDAIAIGAENDGTDEWDGLIDDVVILSGRVMTSDERTEDYNNGDGVSFANWSGGSVRGNKVEGLATQKLTLNQTTVMRIKYGEI